MNWMQSSKRMKFNLEMVENKLSAIQIFICSKYTTRSGRGYDVRIDHWIELKDARQISKLKSLKIIPC